MDVIGLNIEGLQLAVNQHAAAARDVLDGTSAGNASAVGQATSAAVAAANTLVNSASGLLGARLSATGAKVGTVGAVMSEQDHASAQQISAVHP
ncbi:hypothetical protein [Mycolicibacterium confluentis]|uniref:Uncharacterized protein n=1 Tax=Mycolicibacterium confluentis TaxID=28047 RepID=A0A7I7XYR3_9MYCO|nr:hypothetical protein [Mycolicibacterium confluentis]MCV7319470.1 hypothetical protein [Mycolicibacterium confluentis]ORV34104.1 hypothetical protein AWB99_00125 [Mycolicibacterium confluentis]BBZ34490.1 hypothetical protein MCNF_30950 [Mycolicibacterium confluentis]